MYQKELNLLRLPKETVGVLVSIFASSVVNCCFITILSMETDSVRSRLMCISIICSIVLIYYFTDISVDTVKGIEHGRRSMSLDTYLGIVQALETTPSALMSQDQPEKYIERFSFMMRQRSESEVEFVLHMVEQLLKGQDCYLNE